MDGMIDGTQLRVLAEAAGKEAVMPILDAFWQSNDEILRQLESDLSAGDADGAARSAHALKGSASNLGATCVAETAKQIELAAKAADLAAARPSASRLQSEIALTKTAFDQLMASI